MSERTLPGFPAKPAAAIAQRNRIGVAAIDLHRAMTPLLEILDSRCQLTMIFSIGGDKLRVTVTPGKASDTEGQ